MKLRIKDNKIKIIILRVSENNKIQRAAKKFVSYLGQKVQELGQKVPYLGKKIPYLGQFVQYLGLCCVVWVLKQKAERSII